ncbi:MAG TPA: IS110 family transposase [Sumerlaeia bacterium]|nr:IS110 family transposase [Sumerlaeia bacterium]
MSSLHYVGMDVHKKTISYCVKTRAGRPRGEGTIPATRAALDAWAAERTRPWVGAMEATLFTGWIYDRLAPHARELKVAHPLMLRAIACSKRKNDRIDAEKIADLLRADLLPECYMMPADMRDLRRVLRYRNLLVREATRMKNKTSGLFMEVGAEFEKKKIHGKRYFREFVANLADTPPSVIDMARHCHSFLALFTDLQKRLIAGLRRAPLIAERVALLMTIDAIGEINALTWALEIGDPHRFANRRQAISYCGLCGGQDESAGKTKRTPISKKRNKHLQTMLVEAAKLAPNWNARLAAIHERELARGNRNRATLEVARRLVGLLLAVDKSGIPYDPGRR